MAKKIRLRTTTDGSRALLLCALLLVLYCLTISGVASVDAYYYFVNIDRGSLPLLCHPHHLAYLPLAYGWHELWRLLGYGGTTYLPVKLLSLIGAALNLYGFFRLGRLLFPTGRLPYLLMLVLGLSYLPWHYATESEPVIFFQAGATWILYFTLRMRSLPAVTSVHAAQLGAAVGVGTLFHQALAFSLPLGALLLWKWDAGAEKWRRQAALWTTAAVIVGVPYIVLGYLVVGSLRPVALATWAGAFLDEFRDVYSFGHNLRLRLILSGLQSTFMGGSALKPYLQGGRPFDAGFAAAVAPQVFVLGSLGWGTLLAAGRWRRLDPSRRSMIGAVALFAAIYLAAAVYWEPASRKFWAPVQPALIILATLGIRTWQPLRSGRRRQLKGIPYLLGLLPAVLLAGNLSGGILHKHRAHDTEQELPLRLLEIFQPGDLLVMQESRLWQSIHYHFPELTSRPLATYRNQEWARRDTTLHGAAVSLWRTVRGDNTAYVSSAVGEAMRQELEAVTREWGPPGEGHLEIEPLFPFSDFEQDLTRREIEAWRWVRE